jgi:hypothetical protein
VGEKTKAKLLTTFGSAEAVPRAGKAALENAGLTPSLAEKVLSELASIFLGKSDLGCWVSRSCK